MLEINDTEEFPDGISPIDFKTIEQYQWKYPRLMNKYTTLE